MKTSKQRRDIFETLELYGIDTPVNGFVSKIEHILQPFKEIVLYNPSTFKITVGQAKEENYVSYCCEYIPTDHIIRKFQIGNKSFYVKIVANNYWYISKTNYKEAFIVNEKTEKPELPYPLYSIDFVKQDNVMYGIDLDYKVNLIGTGIENILTKDEVVALIRSYYD